MAKGNIKLSEKKMKCINKKVWKDEDKIKFVEKDNGKIGWTQNGLNWKS